MSGKVKLQNQILTGLVVIAVLAVIVAMTVRVSREGFSGFNSRTFCSSHERCVLNGVGTQNLATGTAVRRHNGDGLMIHVEGNMPETQATLELTIKDNCECHCNNLFDCVCGNGCKAGCPFYTAWLVKEGAAPVNVGRMYKFRDGLYRVSKGVNPKYANYDEVIVTFQGNVEGTGSPAIPVMKGRFDSRGVFCS